MQLKDLQELVFDECQLNEDKCKSIADVLMRTKKLKIFKIHNYENVNNGLSSLIYNLSFFSPNLEMLDISRCRSNITETVVSLYKMLKITTTVEVVFAKNIDNLNANLVELFWYSLG
jgi:5'(3')-deoxyribonucleotidase